jgi:hypothetical protein
MLVVPVEELLLYWRTREAITVHKLVALLALPLRPGELGANVYVSES